MLKKTIIFLLFILLELSFNSVVAQQKIELPISTYDFSKCKSKVFDGTTKVLELTSSFKNDLNKLIYDIYPSKDVYIESYTALYDDINAGINKKITFHFVLNGLDKDEFSDNYVLYDGEITQKKDYIINFTVPEAYIDYSNGNYFYGIRIGSMAKCEVLNPIKGTNLIYKYTNFGNEVDYNSIIPLGSNYIVCQVSDLNNNYYTTNQIIGLITVVRKKLKLERCDNSWITTKEYDGTCYGKTSDNEPLYKIVNCPENVELESVIKFLDENNQEVSNVGNGYNLYCYNKLVGQDAEYYLLEDESLADICLDDNYSSEITSSKIEITPPAGTYVYGNSILGTDITYSIDKDIDGSYQFFVPNSSGGKYELHIGDLIKVGEYDFETHYNVDNKYIHNEKANYLADPKNSKVTVEPKTISFTENINLIGKNYDGTTNVLKDQVISLPLLSGLISNDEVALDIDFEKTKYPKADAGEYDLKVYFRLTGFDAGNYKLETDYVNVKSLISAFNFEYNINPKSKNPKTFELTYNNSVLGEDFKVVNKLTKNQSITYKINGNETTIEALTPGSYNVIVSCVENSKIIFQEKVIINVLPRFVEFDDPNIVLNDKYYDGTKNIYPNQAIIPDIKNLVNNEDVNFEIDYEQSLYPDSKIGDYDVYLYLKLVGKHVDNYRLKREIYQVKSSIKQFNFETNINPNVFDVYNLVYGTSVIGEDFKISNTLSDFQSIKYFIENKDITSQMLTAGDYVVKAVLYQNDIPISDKEYKISVEKLKLLVSEPEIYHYKIYDGNDIVLLNGGRCFLTNKISTDDVQVDIQKQLFDNPEVGYNKTITVSFILKGDYENKYITPDDVVYHDGIISPGKIEVQDLTFDKNSYCNNDEAKLTFNVINGFPLHADIIFEDKSINSISIDNIKDENETFKSISFKVPENIKQGEYKAKLCLVDAINEYSYYDIILNMGFENSYIDVLFDDVIFINNIENIFTEYQWFKDGKLIENETMQYYNDLPALKGFYSAKVKNTEGKDYEVCGIYVNTLDDVNQKSIAKYVDIYPNPAKSNEDINICLKNFNEIDLQSSEIIIYNSLGIIIQHINNPQTKNIIVLPKGNYTGAVLVNGNKISFKFIVKD